MQTGRLTTAPWNRHRPHVLVVACSDGRLQQNLDEFLHRGLGIAHYDRLYAPGGGGILASGGTEILRADRFRRECAFLVTSHDIEDIVFIFHGPADDGPDDALCADYTRRLPWATAEEIRARQEQDARDVCRLEWEKPVRTHAFRCEVTKDERVQFVRLPIPEPAIPR